MADETNSSPDHGNDEPGGSAPPSIRWLSAAGTLLSFLLLAATPYGMVLLLEDQLLFYPDRKLEATPADLGLRFREIWLDVDGARCQAWRIFAPRPRVSILFFHGISGNIGRPLPLVAQLVERGYEIFLPEYPGYGRSEGRPSEDAMYALGEAAWTWVHESVDGRPIVIFGQSLGGAVAVEMAARHPAAGLITHAAFTRMSEVRQSGLSFLPWVPPLRNEFDVVARIPDVAIPKLMIHGDADLIVPFSLGQELFAAALEPKRFVRVPGAGHRDLWDRDRELYFGAIVAFIDSLEP